MTRDSRAWFAVGLAIATTVAAQSAFAQSEGATPHSVEAAARVGVKFAGEMSPVNWFHTETQTAPAIGVDVGWVAHPHFTLGGYLLASPFSFERKSGSDVIGEGDGVFVSVGLAAKGRLELSEKAILRGGLNLGRNFVSYDGETNTGAPFELSGGGLNLGAVADGVLRLAPSFGLSAQLGFVSQISGSADVEGFPTNATAEGSTRDFGFKPIVFFTVGPELFL